MFALGMMKILVLFFLSGGLGLPLGIPPAPEDPVLAQVAPEECLVTIAWNGIAQPDPKSSNEVEQLLAEPEVQKLLAGIDQTIMKKIRAEAKAQGPEQETLVEDISFLVRTAVSHPAIAYLSHLSLKKGQNRPPRDVRGGLVVNAGEQTAKVRALLEKLQKQLPPSIIKPVAIDGDTFYQIDSGEGPIVTWGTKDTYFGVTLGEGEVQAILKRGEGQPPTWLQAAIARAAVPRRSSLVYLNVKAWIETLAPASPPDFRKMVSALGLDGLGAISVVSGLDDVGFVSRTHLGVEGELRGLFRLVPDQPLTADELAPIPADAHVALASRLEAIRIYDTVLSIIGQIDPKARARAAESIAQSQDALGLNFREDLLAPLGKTLLAYSSPGDGVMFPFGLTAVVPVSDAAKLRQTSQKLLAFAAKAAEGNKDGSLDQLQFEGHTIHYFQPKGAFTLVQPGWTITDRELVASLSLPALKAFLKRPAGGKSLDTVPEVAGLFSGPAPFKLTYQNTPELFKVFYPTLQLFAGPVLQQLRKQGIDFNIALLPATSTIAKHLRPSTMCARRVADGIDVESHEVIPGGSLSAGTPTLAGLLLPAVQGARAAARRTQSMNNIKQILLAILTYENDKGRYPPAYTTGKDGKPLLSWRVLLLPYIDQDALYKQFHLDEPWDSPHNKQLIARMPAIYRSPQSAVTGGKTTYLTVRGEDTVFPGSAEVTMADIRDGTSNTAVLIEANDQSAVPWTAPDDFRPDPKDPLKGLKSPGRKDFPAGFADGHVQVISDTIAPQVLKALFTRSGGEVVELP